MTEWADTFPMMGEVLPTNDPRVFQTRFVKSEIKDDTNHKSKTKKYFCCTIEGKCYGIDVTRPWARSADKECKEAYFMVKQAADYYETYNKFPQE